MKMEDIQKHVENDMKIDHTALDAESLKIPQLHNKYLNFLHNEKILLKSYNNEYNVLKKIKWEYYTGKLSNEELTKRNWEPFQYKILKNDIEIYMNSDNDLNNLLMKIEIQEQKCDYLESIIKNIMNRHWNIRSSIEWKKFTNGVN